MAGFRSPLPTTLGLSTGQGKAGFRSLIPVLPLGTNTDVQVVAGFRSLIPVLPLASNPLSIPEEPAGKSGGNTWLKQQAERHLEQIRQEDDEIIAVIMAAMEIL